MLRPQLNSKRDLASLNGVWDLELINNPKWSGTKKVAVPASFNDLYTDDKVRNHMGEVKFSRTFKVSDSWQEKQIIIYFEAVSYRAKVFLNGKELGVHETGYTPFEFNITEYVNFGKENLLELIVAQNLSAETIPQSNIVDKDWIFNTHRPNVIFDFFPYTGIHRNVHLYTVNKAHIDKVKVDTDVKGNSGIVTVCGKITGNAKSAELFIAGQNVKSKIKDNAFCAEIKIENAKLWNVGEPNLYNLEISLLDFDAKLTDEYSLKIGIRKIEVKGNSFLVNGKSVYFKGFGKHEDFPIIGKGNCDAVNIRDFELMKWINANSFRTSHYPYSEDILDLADEYGFLVISETPAVSLNFKFANEQTLAVHKKCLTELIERDYNHPSVVMWSVANEPQSQLEGSYEYFKPLVEIVKAMDQSRPVTLVSCFVPDCKAMPLFDVCCINKYPGWYEIPGDIDAAKQSMNDMLDEIYDKYKLPIIITEFGADTIAGFHALPAEMWTEEYQKDLILSLIDVMRTKDFVIGEHIWNFADFRTAQNYIRVNGNKKGIFTRDRQPKMTAHYLKEKWIDKS
jgi:beta-glucuronidase